MRVIKALFKFYINSSIHVALAVCSLVGVTAFQLDIKPSAALLWFIFFGSISGYNFVKYAKVAGLHHRSLTNSLRSIQVFSFFSFVAVVFVAFQLKVNTLTCLAVLGALTLLYAVPLIAGKNLRTLRGAKILVVAVVWTGVTVVAPLLENGTGMGAGAFFVFLQRIFVVVVLTLPFEIRDFIFDKPELGTIPQRVGVKKAKWLGYVLVALIVMLEYGVGRNEWYEWVAILALAALLSAGLFFSKREQPPYYASFWIEGIPMVWFIFLWIFG
ncbi:MAG: hypothetical protein CMC08_02725 [Flavobacteriaceae bacterium]|nr:hypothetical protein [Flavobacteriaceae bacterium]